MRPLSCRANTRVEEAQMEDARRRAGAAACAVAAVALMIASAGPWGWGLGCMLAALLFGCAVGLAQIDLLGGGVDG